MRTKKTRNSPDPGGWSGPRPVASDAPSCRSARWRLSALLGILLLGLLVRVLYLNEAQGEPDFDQPLVDAAFNDYWARGLSSGDWQPPPEREDPHIQRNPYFRPPAYPHFLAAVYALTDGSYLAPRIVQLAIGLAGAALAYLLAARWLHPVSGLLAAAGMCFYWALLYFETQLLALPLLIFLLLAATYVLGRWSERPGARGGMWLLAAGGLVLGLAGLVRANVLLFVLVAAMWAGWVARRSGLRLARSAAAGLLLFVVAGLTVLPVTIRNWRVAGVFVPVSANSGINLYIGNNPDATGACANRLPGLGEFGSCFDYPRLIRRIESKTGREMSYIDADAWLRREAKEYIRKNPGRVAKLVWHKVGMFWGTTEVGHNKEIHYEHTRSDVLRFLPGNFSILAAVGIVGLVLLLGRRPPGGPPAKTKAEDGRDRSKSKSARSTGGKRSRRSANAAKGRGGSGQQPPAAIPAEAPTDVIAQARRPVAVFCGLFVLIFFASFLPFFVVAKFRVLVIPFLIVFASWVPVRVAVLVRQQRTGAVGGALAGCIALGLILLFALPQPYTVSVAKWHGQRATAYLQADKLDRAVAELEKALAADPTLDDAHHNLGYVRFLQGDQETALRHYDVALRINPNRVDTRIDAGGAHLCLARRTGDPNRLQEAEKQYRKALEIRPDHFEAHLGLGTVLLLLGQRQEAFLHLGEAVRIGPDAAEAHQLLGYALSTAGQTEAAIRHWQRALALAPDQPAVRLQLATALIETGRVDEAETYLQELAATDPTNPAVLTARGMLRLRQGRFREALHDLTAAVRRRDDMPRAHLYLGTVRNQLGMTEQAVAAFRRAIELRPDFPQALNNLAWIYATAQDDEHRRPKQAVELAERAVQLTGRGNPSLLDTLAAAYATAGRFDDAVATAREAMQLAQSTGATPLAASLRERLELYEQGKPYVAE